MLDQFDKNKSPFRVPENYFEGLTDNIMNSLPKESVTIKRVPLWKKAAPWVGVAAAVLAVFFAVDVFRTAPSDRTVAQELKKVEKLSEKHLVYNLEYDEEDYYLFLEDESTEAMYVNAFLFEEN